MMKQKQLSNLRLNIINSNYANSKLQYVGNENRKKTDSPEHSNNNNIFDYNKINFSMDNSTDSSSNSFSIAERQVTKKAKNILRTNFLSR